MKHAVLSLLMLWTAIYGLAVYAYGLTGVLSGLSYDKYQGNYVDFLVHWTVFLGPPLFGLTYLILKRLRSR